MVDVVGGTPSAAPEEEETITLSGTSSLDDVYTVYLENSGYFENRSVSEAQLFSRACRMLILLNPRRIKRENEEIEVDTIRIKEQLAEAEAYVARNRAGGNSGTVLADLSSFRD